MNNNNNITKVSNNNKRKTEENNYETNNHNNENNYIIKNAKIKRYHCDNVEYASFKIIEYLIKNTEIQMICSSNGRISDIYFMYKNDVNNVLAIQLKTNVKGDCFKFQAGISAYKGMILLFLSFNETILNNIIEKDKILDENIRNIHYMAITPYFNLEPSDNYVKLGESRINKFKINPFNLYNVIVEYFKDDKIIKKTYVKWDCLCKSERHYKQYVSIKRVSYQLKQYGCDIIQTYDCLSFNAYLKIHNIYVTVNFRKKEEIDSYYMSNNVNILWIYNKNNINLHVVIPMEKIIADGNNSYKNIRYEDYLQYEIDINDKKCIEDIKNIISSHTEDNHVIKNALIGYKYILDEHILFKIINRFNKYSHEELLSKHNQDIKNHEDEHKLIEWFINPVTTKGWPKVCPRCGYTSKHGDMGRHLTCRHPDILAHYKPSYNQNSSISFKKYECSMCKTKFILLDSFKRHKLKKTECNNATCIYL